MESVHSSLKGAGIVSHARETPNLGSAEEHEREHPVSHTSALSSEILDRAVFEVD